MKLNRFSKGVPSIRNSGYLDSYLPRIEFGPSQNAIAYVMFSYDRRSASIGLWDFEQHKDLPIRRTVDFLPSQVLHFDEQKILFALPGLEESSILFSRYDLETSTSFGTGYTEPGLSFLERGVFNADGTLLALSRGALFDVNNAVLITSLNLHSDFSVAFTPDSGGLIITGRDAIRVWDITSAFKGFAPTRYDIIAKSPTRSSRRIERFAINADGTLLAAEHLDGSIVCGTSKRRRRSCRSQRMSG